MPSSPLTNFPLSIATAGAVPGVKRFPLVAGELNVFSDRVHYTAPNKQGLITDYGTASCSDLTDWKADWLGRIPGGPYYFHIRFKNGVDWDMEAQSKNQMKAALDAVSKACGPHQ